MRPVSVTQQQVLDCLAKVASPQGVALTDAKVLARKKLGIARDE